MIFFYLPYPNWNINKSRLQTLSSNATSTSTDPMNGGWLSRAAPTLSVFQQQLRKVLFAGNEHKDHDKIAGYEYLTGRLRPGFLLLALYQGEDSLSLSRVSPSYSEMEDSSYIADVSSRRFDVVCSDVPSPMRI